MSKAKTVKKVAVKAAVKDIAAITAPTKATVKENLRVRAKPANTAATLGVVPAGKVVDVLSVDGIWAKVALTSGGQPLFELGGVVPAYGYMSATYLTFGDAPVPATSRRGVGMHVLGNAGVALAAVTNGEYKDVCVIQDYESCKRLCDILGKTEAFDGKGIVIFREYINYWPTVQQALNYCRPGFDKRVLRVITNESEKCPDGNTVEGILRHAALDVAVARELAKTGEVGLLGSFAVGNPNITDPAICKAMYDGYADWFNNGYKQTGVHPVFDQHYYSPDAAHIYNTWEGDVQMALPITGVVIKDMVPHMASSASASAGVVTEIVGWKNDGAGTPVTRLAVGDAATLKALGEPAQPTQGISAGVSSSGLRNLHVYEQDWHETRAKFYYELCGFNLAGGGLLVSTETGVDKGGFGGFIGCGMNMEDFIKWVHKYREIWTRPVKDWYGNTGAMPMEAGVVFQGADRENGPGHWGSYYIDPPWQAALIAAVRGA